MHFCRDRQRKWLFKAKKDSNKMIKFEEILMSLGSRQN